MKKKFLLSLAVVLCTIALVAGGTFALFTDSTSTSSADFTAGKLVITNERDQGDTVPGPMFYVTSAQGETSPGLNNGRFPTGVWAPGDSKVRTLNVYNRAPSTMDAWLDSVQANLVSGTNDMAAKLWVEVFTPDVENPLVSQKLAEGWLTDFLSGSVNLRYPDGSKVLCSLTGTVQLQFKVTFHSSAGNDLQGQTLVADFVVNAVQAKNNP